MDSRIVKAIVWGNVDLARKAIIASNLRDLNHPFTIPGQKPYTILDATIQEANNAEIGGHKNALQKIILELRNSGAKTFNELTNVKSGLPPRAVTRYASKANRNKGIAASKKNRRRSWKNDIGITNKNMGNVNPV